MTPSKSRTYTKRKRAEAEQETRRRITEAAVELHGTVGPAHATVTDVARLAGVSRMTVYNHFPTEVDLFRACSAHWAERNPFPDPTQWTGVDPVERLVGALEELYRWYRAKQGMLGNVLRDTRTVPALAVVMTDLWDGYMDGLVTALSKGWATATTSPDELRAMLRLGVDFNTWTLLSESGMDEPMAAELVARMVACATADGDPACP